MKRTTKIVVNDRNGDVLLLRKKGRGSHGYKYRERKIYSLRKGDVLKRASKFKCLVIGSDPVVLDAKRNLVQSFRKIVDDGNTKNPFYKRALEWVNRTAE